tara:strand:+ start:3075 stop:6236 length:3162 start_codon:yes stop_codon:yes gene_type:complete
MAKTVDQYIIQVKTSGTKESEKNLGKVDKTIKKVGSSAKRAAKAGMAALGAALVASAGYALKTAKEFEALKTRLNTLYGSLNAGTKAFNTFNQIASTTPFALKDVVEAGASLKAFGLDAEENIKGLSDLAAFMGVDIVEAAGAMGRAFAGGAGAADVFRDRGVLNIIKMREGIDDLSKVSLPEFRVMMKEAIEDPTLGIAGATDALSQTFTGRYSNMMDSVDKLANHYGEKLLPIAEKVVRALGATADSMSGARNAFDVQIESIRTGQVELKILKENLEKTEQGTTSWNIQLMKIKKEYPDFLAGLKDEDITLAKLNEKYDDYNSLSAERIAILQKEKERASLLQQQTNLINDQSKSSTEFAVTLERTDDLLTDMYLAAAAKADLNTQAGRDFVANLRDIRDELTLQEEKYLDGKISTEEFYKAAKTAQEDFVAELNSSKTFAGLFNDVLQESGTIIKDSGFQQMAISKHASDVVENTEKLDALYQKNKSSLEKINKEYDVISGQIKKIDNDLDEMSGDEDEGVIPAPSAASIKQYDKILSSILKTVDGYNKQSLDLANQFANAELDILKNKNNKTIEELQEIANIEQSMLNDRQSNEIDSLLKTQDEIRKSKEEAFQYAVDNNILDEEQQQEHLDEMKALEETFIADMENLKGTHRVEQQQQDINSDAAIQEARKSHHDEMIAAEQDYAERLKEIGNNIVEGEIELNDIRRQNEMDRLSFLAQQASASEIETFAGIDRQTEFEIESMKNRFDQTNALIGENEETRRAAEEESYAAEKERIWKPYNDLKERFEADGVLNEEEREYLRLENMNAQLDEELAEFGHEERLTKIQADANKARFKANKNHENATTDTNRKAAIAKMKIAVRLAQGLLGSFKDNAELLFNMNKKDKKRLLNVEKAVAAAAGIAEIAGIWKSAPQGIAGVPFKAAATVQAALRTAGNIAKIDDQIAALDKDSGGGLGGSGGGGDTFSFGSQQAATGYSGVIDNPTNLLVGEAGAEMVNVTPLDGREGSGGGETVVNISGNVMSQDFVEGELRDRIEEAVRRGSDFGLNQ